MWIQSLALLSGLRILHCCELWCGLQMWLGSHIAVAVVEAGSCMYMCVCVLFKNLFMAEPCTLNPTTLECLPQNSLNPSPSRAGNRQVSRAFQKGHSAWKMIPMDQSLLPTLLSSIPVPCGVNQMPQRILKLMFSFFWDSMVRTGPGRHLAGEVLL